MRIILKYISLFNMFNERMRQYYGSSDFIIHANGNASSRNFNVENADPYLDQLEYIIGGFQAWGRLSPLLLQSVRHSSPRSWISSRR
jgi:hypothetical protein